MNPLIEARNHRHDFVGFGLAGQSVAHDASLTKHPDPIHQIKHDPLTQVVADDNDRNTLLLQTSDDLLDPGGFLNTQAAVGSSNMMSFSPQPAARAIATHWR